MNFTHRLITWVDFLWWFSSNSDNLVLHLYPKFSSPRVSRNAGVAFHESLSSSVELSPVRFSPQRRVPCWDTPQLSCRDECPRYFLCRCSGFLSEVTLYQSFGVRSFIDPLLWWSVIFRTSLEAKQALERPTDFSLVSVFERCSHCLLLRKKMLRSWGSESQGLTTNNR